MIGVQHPQKAYYLILCDGTMSETLVIAGSSNCSLATQICKKVGCKLGLCKLERYKDGEIKISVGESVRDKCVFVIQSITSTSTMTINDILIELYLLIRTLKRASVGKVILFIPYFGYSRQDRKVKPRVPISASDVAMMLELAGADRVVGMELHCGQIQGFFRNISCDNLHASCILASAFVEDHKRNTSDSNNRLVVVSPDAGGVARAKQFKETLANFHIESDFAIIVKERSISCGTINNMNLVGNVRDKSVVIVDDMCDTGGTLIKAVDELLEFGAKDIFVCIAHPVFSDDALTKIENSKIKLMYVTDTIPLERSVANVKQVSTSDMFASVVDIFVNGGSINDLLSRCASNRGSSLPQTGEMVGES